MPWQSALQTVRQPNSLTAGSATNIAHVYGMTSVVSTQCIPRSNPKVNMMHSASTRSVPTCSTITWYFPCQLLEIRPEHRLSSKKMPAGSNAQIWNFYFDCLCLRLHRGVCMCKGSLVCQPSQKWRTIYPTLFTPVSWKLEYTEDKLWKPGVNLNRRSLEWTNKQNKWTNKPTYGQLIENHVFLRKQFTQPHMRMKNLQGMCAKISVENLNIFTWQWQYLCE